MKPLGQIRAYRQKENLVYITFEQGEMEIQIINECIVRFFWQLEEVRPKSKAVETDRSVETAYTAVQKDNMVLLTTDALEIRIYEDGKTDIYDRKGTPLCLDYRGERKFQNGLSAEDAELKAQEGHEAETGEADHVIQILKQMDGDECFYGLGDKTGFLNKRGYEYLCWNTDNPAPHVDTFKALYKSIPFFITLKNNGVYGLFFDNTFRTYFNFGKESEEYFWFGADRGNLDYYFIYGEKMTDVVQGYTFLTGTVPLPQLWTLGYHQSRWGYKTEKDVRRIAAALKKYDIPCDAIHLDIDYMERYKVFTVDPAKFSDFKALAEELSEQGLRLVTIIDPGVKVEAGYEIYEQGIQQGYFAKDKDGKVYENVVWPGDSVYPDFGRREVREWWGEQYRTLTDLGAAGIWTDMNEPASFHGELPDDVVFFDEDRESCHAEQHNLYGHNMARATYAGLKKLTGKRPFVITRACYSGTQKYSIAWTGDNQSIWAHLQMAIPQICNLGLSGMPFVGSDIGGFSADSNKELLCRWIQVGAFSPFCRNHASIGTREQEPWMFDEETLNICRKYLKLRYALLPYLYDLFVQGTQNGLPIMRPLVLHYEKDENVRNMNGQFLFGEKMLIAPVTEPGMTQKLVYLPEGSWYDFWTGEKLEGGKYVIREAKLDTCPIYVKAGTILPMRRPGHNAMEGKDEELLLAVYPGEGKTEYLHYQDNGENFEYQHGEYNLYHFTLEGNVVSVEIPHLGYKKAYDKITALNEETEIKM